MRFLTKVLVTTLAVFIASWMFEGVVVDKFTTAIMVAIVLAFFNIFLKPLLIILTIPLTIVTFGLFLIVINAAIILLASDIVEGFYVHSFWTAFWFSIILSVLVAVLESFDPAKRKIFFHANFNGNDHHEDESDFDSDEKT
ncbi:MAG: phage holin family protein [Bacteroidetes bacterium]|nr:phage holin family protein [Bacteroidota bacterium]MBU1719820.1 phage holin family protein [Bacteroidota bacterium]